MKRLLPLALLILGLAAGNLRADTLVVLPGSSIQDKIDEAADGDIIAIFGGSYAEDITINKAVRLVELQGQDVILLGNVTFDGVADCPPFDGFTVGSEDKDIIIRDTTGLIVSNIDHTAGDDLFVIGESSVRITDCQLSAFIPDSGSTEISNSSIARAISQGGGTLHASNVTVAGNFNISSEAVETVAFRCTVNKFVTRSSKAWFGYGQAKSCEFLGSNAKYVLVGNQLKEDPTNSWENTTVRINVKAHGSNNQFLICNNTMELDSLGSGQNFQYIHHIEYLDRTGTCRIQNNYFSHRARGQNGIGIDGRRRYDSIYADEKIDKLVIRNNIFRLINEGEDFVSRIVSAPFGAVIENNLVYGSVRPNEANISITLYATPSHGAVAVNTIIEDPQFVDGNPHQLELGSPAIDAGTDPRYNDFDGSPADLGPSGGAWYDPEGWTTDKPVVISFDLAPELVLEGVDTEVTIDEVKAVSAP